MNGVEIDWSSWWRCLRRTRCCRRNEVRYEIKFPAALVSRHTQRRAIRHDDFVAWTLSITDFQWTGGTITAPPRSGLNHAVVDVGAASG